MPLFGPKRPPGTEGPSLSNLTGVTGLRVLPPEVTGSIERRSRMFGEAMRLAESGTDLVPALDGLLSRERSFVKWVSLRGGLTFVSIALEDPHLSLADLTRFAKRPAPTHKQALLDTYPRIEVASLSDVLDDPMLVQNNDWHIDFLAWCATAFVGGNLHRTLLQAEIPPAQVLTEPGWYAEPEFSKCERYWDGHDWTARCRALEGRQWKLIVAPLHRGSNK